MIARILWSFVLVTTLYVLAVFFQPQKADELGDVFGIKQFNVILREAKNGGAQDIDTNLNSTGGIIDELQGHMNTANSALNSARTTAEETKRLIELKKKQAESLIDSSNAVIDGTKKVQSDFNALTSLSGADVTGSGKTSTGTVSSGSVRTTNK